MWLVVTLLSLFLKGATTTATGRLTRNATASSAATANCTGLLPGTNPANMPAATPADTDRRLRCQRFGWRSSEPKRATNRFCLTDSRLGRYFRKNFLGMGD